MKSNEAYDVVILAVELIINAVKFSALQSSFYKQQQTKYIIRNNSMTKTLLGISIRKI